MKKKFITLSIGLLITCIITSGYLAANNIAAHFESGDNERLTVAHNSNLNSSDITIETWVKLESYNHSSSAAVAIATKRTAASNGYFLFFFNNQGNRLHFDWGGNGNRWNTGYVAPLNEWVHIAVTRDNNGRNLYVNGKLEASTSNSGNSSTASTTADLGVGWNSMQTNNRQPFKGEMEEFRIWDRALSQSEIQENMFREIPGAASVQDLSLYFRFNEGSGNSVTDLSENNNDGTFNTGHDWVVSTAPIGQNDGFIIMDNDVHAIGDGNAQMEIEITSTPNNDNFIAVYSNGAAQGDAEFNDAINSESHIDRRSNKYWGIKAFGSVSVDVSLYYDELHFIDNPAELKILKRDYPGAVWNDVTNDFTVDTANGRFYASGLTSFSEFSFGGDSQMNPVPVEMLYFKGENRMGTNILNWATASEKNNDYFHVKRSANGRDYQIIGTVGGHGNSSQTLRYSFEDNRPLSGINYYKLKQVDYDGTFEYSKIISVRSDEATIVEGFSVYPVPTSDNLHIKTAAYEGPVEYRIINLVGEELLSGHYEANLENPTYKLSVSELIGGTYIMNVNTTNASHSQRIQISK